MAIEFGLVKKIRECAFVRDLKGVNGHVASWKIRNALPRHLAKGKGLNINKVLSGLSRPELELTLKNLRGEK